MFDFIKEVIKEEVLDRVADAIPIEYIPVIDAAAELVKKITDK